MFDVRDAKCVETEEGIVFIGECGETQFVIGMRYAEGEKGKSAGLLDCMWEADQSFVDQFLHPVTAQ